MNEDISDKVIKDVEKYLKFNLDKVDRKLSVAKDQQRHKDVLVHLIKRFSNDNMSLWKKEGTGYIACGSIEGKTERYITSYNEIKASDFTEIAHDSSGEYIRAKPRDEWLSTIAAIVKYLTVLYLRSIREGFEIDFGDSLNHLIFKESEQLEPLTYRQVAILCFCKKRSITLNNTDKTLKDLSKDKKSGKDLINKNNELHEFIGHEFKDPFLSNRVRGYLKRDFERVEKEIGVNDQLTLKRFNEQFELLKRASD